MGYLVVTAVEKKSGLFHLVLVDESSFVVSNDYGFVSADNILQLFKQSGGQLKTLNFSLDRNGKLLQDCGDFGRFSPKGSAIVLAEIKSPAGRTLGYRLLSCANNACVNLRTEEILQRDALMGGNEHFLQNGIVRNDTVNCYPRKPFPELLMNSDRPKNRAPQKPVAKEKVQKPKSTYHPKSEYTKEQLAELDSCAKAGVSIGIIENPKLTPKQMRIIWMSKSKGCLSEAFADPKYTESQMIFYAHRLMDKSIVNECREMLDHPELDVDTLAELYLCVCEGVPYTDYIGLPAEEIFVKREKLLSTYWGSIASLNSDYMEKALNVARHIQEGT